MDEKKSAKAPNQNPLFIKDFSKLLQGIGDLHLPGNFRRGDYRQAIVDEFERIGTYPFASQVYAGQIKLDLDAAIANAEASIPKTRVVDGVKALPGECFEVLLHGMQPLVFTSRTFVSTLGKRFPIGVLKVGHRIDVNAKGDLVYYHSVQGEAYSAPLFASVGRTHDPLTGVPLVQHDFSDPYLRDHCVRCGAYKNGTLKMQDGHGKITTLSAHSCGDLQSVAMQAYPNYARAIPFANHRADLMAIVEEDISARMVSDKESLARVAEASSQGNRRRPPEAPRSNVTSARASIERQVRSSEALSGFYTSGNPSPMGKTPYHLVGGPMKLR